MSNELMAEVDEYLKNEVSQRHSYFQLKYFVIGKEPTIQSKLWQCLRELKTRKESLDSIALEIEEMNDRIELLDISITKMKIDQNAPSLVEDRYGAVHQRECEVKIRQIERQRTAAKDNLAQLDDRKKWLLEECRFFLETYKGIAKLEPLKPFDDLDAQKEYWGQRLSQKLNLKMLTNGQLDTELVETIVALPEDMQIKKQTIGLLAARHSELTQKKPAQNQIQENG